MNLFTTRAMIARWPKRLSISIRDYKTISNFQTRSIAGGTWIEMLLHRRERRTDELSGKH